MKKYFLYGALAVASLLNATNINNATMRNFAEDSRKIEASVIPFEWKDPQTFIKEHDGVRAAQAAEYDLADWYYAPGSFYLGLYEGLGGYNLGMILLPMLDSVVFYNYYGPTDWMINGTVYAEGTDEFVTKWDVNGLYYVPQTTDHDFNPKRDWGAGYKDTTVYAKGTLYAEAANGQYLCSAIEGKYMNGENIYMTLCGMWADPFYEENGNDFWRVGGGATGDPYFNGTGVHIDGDSKTADTLGIIVDNRGVMKIEQILFPVYADNKSTPQGLIPDGVQLRVAIFPLDDKGIHFDDTIASTVISNADIVGDAASWGYYGTMHAKFFETDIFGSESQVPVWVDGDFYLQLTNFNETGCDFGFFSDYDCPTTATTVYQHDGQFSYRGGRNSGGGSYGQNLGISFDAYWPTLVNDTACNELIAPISSSEEEIYAHYGDDEENVVIWMLSNVNYEEWNVETEDWIEPAIVSTDYWEDYRAIALVFIAQPLPEGETGRRATVTLEADGATYEFVITQGEAPDAVESTKVDFRHDGKTYNMLGVEVGDDFKGVVIRNGEKSIR